MATHCRSGKIRSTPGVRNEPTQGPISRIPWAWHRLTPYPFTKGSTDSPERYHGGWQVNTTYRYTTGQPFTVVERYTGGSLCDPGVL